MTTYCLSRVHCYKTVNISTAYPINSPSFVAANANFHKAAYNSLLEKWHWAPSFEFVTRQSYPRQFFFGRDGLWVPSCSPLACLLIFLWVRTPWRHWWWWRWWWRATSLINCYTIIITTFIHFISIAVVSIAFIFLVVVRVHVLGFQSLLLQPFSFFLCSLLLQQLRYN